MDPKKRQKIEKRKSYDVIIICLTCLFSTIRSEFGQTLWFWSACLMYSIHENHHFMYDSCTIHRVVSIDLRRGCLFLFFTFMSRSSFAHFHFSFFHLVFLSLYSYIYLYLTAPINHQDAHICFIFHIKPLNIANKAQMQMHKRTRNILSICKTRYERKSGPAYLQIGRAHV